MQQYSGDPTDDQARRLRQLAQPSGTDGPTSRSTNKQFRHLQPHVVLVSEFPGLQQAYLLAWHLAHRLSNRRVGSRLVDLAPAASRLPHCLATAHPARDGLKHLIPQPLWSESLHGRRLASWVKVADSPVSIVAQPAGHFPTAEQMPRICEQLLRAVRRAGDETGTSSDSAGRQNLILLSECNGLPLDQACWQAADEIILLVPELPGASELVRSAIAARLPQRSDAQRIFLLWQRNDWRSGWLPAHYLLRRLEESECRWSGTGVEHFRLLRSPRETLSSSGVQRAGRVLARASRQLTLELMRISVPVTPNQGGRTRKAG